MALSEKDWFQAGKDMLRQARFSQITIRDLCQKLKVSTGSFYHHFKNREDYVGRLFGHWVEDQRSKAEAFMTDPETALERFNAQSEKLMDHKLEVAMRAWALFDPLAAEKLRHFDEERYAFVGMLYAGVPAAKRKNLIHLHLCSLIGAQFLMPDAKDVKSFGAFVNKLAADLLK